MQRYRPARFHVSEAVVSTSNPSQCGKGFYFYTDVDTVYQGTEADVKECFDYEYVPVQ
jgi:hypothetical protein